MSLGEWFERTKALIDVEEAVANISSRICSSIDDEPSGKMASIIRLGIHKSFHAILCSSERHFRNYLDYEDKKPSDDLYGRWKEMKETDNTSFVMRLLTDPWGAFEEHPPPIVGVSCNTLAQMVHIPFYLIYLLSWYSYALSISDVATAISNFVDDNRDLVEFIGFCTLADMLQTTN